MPPHFFVIVTEIVKEKKNSPPLSGCSKANLVISRALNPREMQKNDDDDDLDNSIRTGSNFFFVNSDRSVEFDVMSLFQSITSGSFRFFSQKTIDPLNFVQL